MRNVLKALNFFGTEKQTYEQKIATDELIREFAGERFTFSVRDKWIEIHFFGYHDKKVVFKMEEPLAYFLMEKGHIPRKVWIDSQYFPFLYKHGNGEKDIFLGKYKKETYTMTFGGFRAGDAAHSVETYGKIMFL
jgi:hypothetical protein